MGGPLTSINNLALKQLVAQMHEAGFAAKTILNYLQVVKAVVGSLMTEDAEPVFSRKWNHEFIDLPIVRDQNTPMLTRDEIEQIFGLAQGWYRVLLCQLAGTGMRIGEALALEISDLSGDASTVQIRQNLYNRTLGTPKTPSGVREIDLAAGGNSKPNPILSATSFRNRTSLRTGLPACKFPSN